MRAILGYLFREATNCRFRYDRETVDYRWITEIRDLDPGEPIRRDVLYVAPDGIAVPEIDEQHAAIPLILSEEQVSALLDCFAPIVPEPSMEVRAAVQSLRDAMHELEKWNLAMYQAACFGSGLEELLNMAGNMTPNHIYVADMSFRCWPIPTARI